jgi:hypothetical protein
MIPSHRRRDSQRGSAILVILVFAAVIAIALYRELPVATFEAQRQKEELLMDRGNEYKRAVQLYVRKIQSFPPTLDALENTNRMRFLRSRYVDPFTGKADWRLLHAGPGGAIIDSKIKGNGSTLAGASGSTSNPLGAPSSVTNPFANSFNGADPTGQAGGQPANNFPQRPPTISANGADGQTSPDPIQTAPYPGYPAPPDPSNPLSTGSSSPTGSGPGRLRLGNPTGNSYPPGTFPDSSQLGGSTDPQNPMIGALGTTNPTPTNQNAAPSSTSGFSFNQPANTTGASSSSTPGLGTMNPSNVGAGIAGVASTAAGKTIKIFNDQSDRSLWEFVYDMQKDAAANAPGLGNNNGNTNTNTNPQGTGNSNNPSTFNSTFSGSNQNGAPNQSSTFPTQSSSTSN